MTVYAESYQAAQERLERIRRRYCNAYTGSYYLQRAFDSATNRMTNLIKLEKWAAVLRDAGYEHSANYAYNRIKGLQNGNIAAPQRRRLARSTVPAYVPVPALRDVAEGVISFVNYKFTPEVD